MLIDVYVTQEPSGWTFHLSPSECKKIKNTFVDALPVSFIFVSNETGLTWEQILKNVLQHIKPALLGLDEKKLSEMQVVFKDSSTEQILKTAS